MTSPFSMRLGMALSDRGPLCVGIDPSPALLHAWGLEDDASGAEHFARLAIDALWEHVGVVKFQVAFYERHGSAGYQALERMIAHARGAGLLVIGDAKRGDIVSTNEGYAEAWLTDGSPLSVDAMTVSCYLGAAALKDLFAVAHRNGRGVFAVVSSSNDEGRRLQTATTEDGRSVEEALLSELGSFNKMMDGGGQPSRCVGAVIGAQRRPAGLSGFDGPVLVPGTGAQGGDEADVAELRALLPHDRVTVNVSRSILSLGPSPSALQQAAVALNAALA